MIQSSFHLFEFFFNFVDGSYHFSFESATLKLPPSCLLNSRILSGTAAVISALYFLLLFLDDGSFYRSQ